MYIVMNQDQVVGVVVFAKEPYVEVYATEAEAQKQVDYMNEKSKIKGWGDKFYYCPVKVNGKEG